MLVVAHWEESGRVWQWDVVTAHTGHNGTEDGRNVVQLGSGLRLQWLKWRAEVVEGNLLGAGRSEPGGIWRVWHHGGALHLTLVLQ